MKTIQEIKIEKKELEKTIQDAIINFMNANSYLDINLDIQINNDKPNGLLFVHVKANFEI